MPPLPMARAATTFSGRMRQRFTFKNWEKRGLSQEAIRFGVYIVTPFAAVWFYHLEPVNKFLRKRYPSFQQRQNELSDPKADAEWDQFMQQRQDVQREHERERAKLRIARMKQQRQTNQSINQQSNQTDTN